MHSVESIAAEIVRREGGFVNDPDDPGGATNHGVTIHTMRRLGLDLTGDGEVDAADVQGARPGEGGGDLRPPLLPRAEDRPLAGAAAAERLRHAGQRRRQRRAHPAAADGGLRAAA